MLYLEDYLELIEHLPQELRDRFTDIRENDLQVHNSSEQLREKQKLFFAEAKRLTPEQRQCDFEKLLKDYEQVTKYADSKVQIATQMQDIMIKLTQRLDGELEKFKLELEADHAGITEELEKRSLELDSESRIEGIIGEHLNGSTSNNIQHDSSKLSNLQPSLTKDRRRSEHRAQRHNPYQNNTNNSHNNGYHGRAKLSYHSDLNNPSSTTNNHHHQNGSMPNGSSRTQATSSSPILDSNYMSFSGPASVASDSAQSCSAESGHFENNLSYGNHQTFKHTTNKNTKKKIQDIDSNMPPYNHQNNTNNHQPHSALSAALSSTSPQINSVSPLFMPWNVWCNPLSNNSAQSNNSSAPTPMYHRDETKYCVCRQISYGEMVACDNDECEIEWFHYDCVGVTQPPKGKWFCPDCNRKMQHQQQQEQQQQFNNHHNNNLNHQTNNNIAKEPQTQKKRGRKEKSVFNLVNNSIEPIRSRNSE